MRQVMYSDGTPSREIEDDDDGRPHALDLLVEQKKRIAELEALLAEARSVIVALLDDANSGACDAADELLAKIDNRKS